MRRSLKRLSLLAALSLVMATGMVMASPAEAKKYSKGCNTKACMKRVCKSNKCRTRVAARIITAADRAWLERTGECEDNDNPAAGPTGYASNTGNGFRGRYQFDLGSWWAAATSKPPITNIRMPDQAPPLIQDLVALRWRKLAGRGAWPVCG